MNYLAHLLLAAPDEEAMLGAFLGDFVKGRNLNGFAPVVAREIYLHRRIDSFTDEHPVVRSALALFEPGQRRYAGIALDVFWDHVLARDFEQHAGVKLATFVQQAYRLLEQHAAELTPRARLVAERMAAQDWLMAYADFSGVERAVHGLGQRLSHGGEQLEACAVDLRCKHARLAEGFSPLFTDVRAFASAQRARWRDAGRFSS